MYNIEQNIDEQIVCINKTKPVIIFPEADDPRIIKCLPSLYNKAKIVLLTSREHVEKILLENSYKKEQINNVLGQIKLINPEDPSESVIREEFALELTRISKGTKWEITLEEANVFVRQKILYSIMAVRLGYADTVLGGIASASKDFFSPCLRFLNKEGTVFQAALFTFDTDTVFPGNLAFFADVAVNNHMTPEKLADIAIGTCQIARDIIPKNVLPTINASILSYSTKGSGEGESVDIIRNAQSFIKKKLELLCNENSDYASIRIHSEMQVSCALSKTAAEAKLKTFYHPNEGMGESNILISPNLDLGNFLYHYHATVHPSSKKLLLSGGFLNQALDFSRSSTTEDIIIAAKAVILRTLKSKKYVKTARNYFFPVFRMLTLNPGSTSTKIVLYYGDIVEFSTVIEHSRNKLMEFNHISDQYMWRKEIVIRELKDHNIDLNKIDVIVARGGLLAPVIGGTYLISEKMCKDLKEAKYGEHASNLGALIAFEISKQINKKAYIVDPVVVDEMAEKNKVTGFKDVNRKSLWHALNQRQIGKLYAMEKNTYYQNLNLIIAHLGGGISISAHKKGMAIDVINGLTGEGPFSPERSGSIPATEIIDLCFSGNHSKDDLVKKVTSQSGLVEHLGTHDSKIIEQRIADGDKRAKVVYEAMIYNIAKNISSMLPAFEGDKIDAILITGGLAKSRYISTGILKYLEPLNISKVFYPGEFEMEALKFGAMQVLKGEELARDYTG